VRIFDDHRSRYRMALFHAALEFTLSNVLNVLIDGGHYTVARLRFFFNAGKPFLARVNRDHQLAGLPLELLVKLPLQSTQALIVGANVT
jgi:hypothetical protein